MADTQYDMSKKDRRVILVKAVMQLFQHWQLSVDQQLMMLGLAPSSRLSLARYRKGGPLAPNQDILDRAVILLDIHKNLRMLFPRNRELVYKWISQPNKAFKGMTPIDVISARGIPGLIMVRAYLDEVAGQ